MKNTHILGLILLAFCFSFTGCAKTYSFTSHAMPNCSPKYHYNSIRIIPFESNYRHYGRELAALVAGGITKENFIAVTHHAAECELSAELRIGGMNSEMSSFPYECEKENDGKKYKTTCYRYEFSKRINIEISYVLKRREGGEILCADSFSLDYDKTWTSYESSSDARASALTDGGIIDAQLKKLAEKMIHAVSPHRVEIERELEKGHDDENIDQGIKYLLNGRAELAMQQWDLCIEQAVSKQDIAAAWYNIGVVKESLFRFKDAFYAYSKALDLFPENSKYLKSLKKVEDLSIRQSDVGKW